MTAVMLPEQDMAKERKDMPVRITGEAMKWARIAASFKGMTLAEYVSAAILEVAKQDVDRGYIDIKKPAKPSKRSEGKQ